MFACKDLQVFTSAGGQRLLSAGKIVFRKGQLNAVIGPSGCGKTTLIKGLMGILPATGEIHYGERLVENPEQLRGQVGFAPQFSIAQPRLTVRESLSYALELLVADSSIRRKRLDQILEATGLQEHAEKKVASLSGGQLRRIGLGLEMTTDPETLFCDEVTSGLDPLSEDQILTMLRNLCDSRGKTFICVIHNLGKLDDFDWVTVVHQGAVVFQGTPDEVRSHFGIHDFLGLYEQLQSKSVDGWLKLWVNTASQQDSVDSEATSSVCSLPSGVSQTWTLLKRRMLLFFRDRGTLLLTLAITLGFPCMVVIFSIGGLPQIASLSMEQGTELFARIQENIRYSKEALEVGGLVSGLIMFQVILLTLMGSNNGSREIAGERMLYEKERLSGVRPMAYVMAKTVFVSGVAIVQGVWMTVFVKAICQFPGSWITCSAILVLVVLAMSMLSLGFSAVFVSSEKASLLSIYLVGFQLPLSGVVLALPEYMVWVLRPLINAFWGWAGYLKTMQDTRWYDAVMVKDFGWIPEVSLSILVLMIHTAVGFFLVMWGCQRKTAI
jgi:ABC-type multidrug transport system ATPase subunit